VATARRRPTARDTVRALWLLGLREPADVDEIRAAWRDRVAQAHPDRRRDNNEAATRLTAAFNDARDI
jgi:curved DNA-binding protein CbpA